MSLSITEFTQLSPAQVSVNKAKFSQILLERYPDFDLGAGVLHDLVAYLSGGVSGAVNQAEIERVLSSQSLLDINNNPDLAEDELVDRVLSNYRITRRSGSVAAGQVSIIVTGSASVVIPAGQLFTTNGLNFVAITSFTARPPGVPLQADTDRSLTSLADGTYIFSIPLSAAAEGASYNIRRSSRLVPDPTSPRIVSVTAATDFTGGAAQETNAQMLTRLNSGMSVKAWSNRTNIRALIRDQVAFSAIQDIAIIGFGNREMLRDQHSIFPVSFGGKTDLYVRSEALPRRSAVDKTATLVNLVGGVATWQFTVGADDLPGFYEASYAVRKSNPAGAQLPITTDLRGLDIPTDVFTPDVDSIVEGAYSRFQTAVMRCQETVSNPSELVVGSSTVDLAVTLTGQPLISELQDFCSRADVRDPAGDALVRAAIPCWLTVSFAILQSPSTPTPDVSAIQQAVADAVNSLGFTGRLHTSQISDVVHYFLVDRQALGPVGILGRMRLPDGSERFLSSNTILVIPDLSDVCATGRTVALYLDPTDVVIDLRLTDFNAET